MRQQKILITALILFISVASASALERAAIPFSFNSSFGEPASGVRLHFTDVYALEPLLGFHFQEDNSHFRFSIRNLFYISEIGTFEPYFVAALRGDFDGNFGLDGRFALQHTLTGPLDIVGEVGFNTDFDPFQFYSAQAGLGIVFYIRQ
ncbi:hypothetical protein [Chitinivibrio alkaliphilus]|uniref:Secreted protein n=1 Tax=Chitinivibrio alkaliphilus ACht1 TaxID=1313304 RepID=U7D8N0_9BACT|nr:hypothetical protein [Chitinivibrio alkaliphilus]ERP30790.1 hypothetical protein CALK_2356 [Chitinivibrio alkaliphilus ACht1]